MGVICNSSDKRKNSQETKVISFNSLDNNILYLHNFYRKKHNSPNLELNDELCKMAKNYAKESIINKNKENIFKYNDEILGQNIYLSKIRPKQLEKVINEWYEENRNYDYNSKYYQKNAAHFTQIVWKETKEIGFGSAGENNFCLVVFYYPAGNILGKFTENVENPNKKKK